MAILDEYHHSAQVCQAKLCDVIEQLKSVGLNDLQGVGPSEKCYSEIGNALILWLLSIVVLTLTYISYIFYYYI